MKSWSNRAVENGPFALLAQKPLDNLTALNGLNGLNGSWKE
jgi:hypothetical protein